jgi:hypothetical protein
VSYAAPSSCCMICRRAIHNKFSTILARIIRTLVLHAVTVRRLRAVDLSEKLISRISCTTSVYEMKLEETAPVPAGYESYPPAAGLHNRVPLFPVLLSCFSK